MFRTSLGGEYLHNLGSAKLLSSVIHRFIQLINELEQAGLTPRPNFEFARWEPYQMKAGKRVQNNLSVIWSKSRPQVQGTVV